MGQRADGTAKVNESDWLVEARERTQTEIKLAEMAAKDKEQRRIWWQEFLAGLAIMIVVLSIAAGIIVAVVYSHHSDEKRQIRIEQERAKAAQECIRQGNLWYRGDCLITRRAG
jgi:uncharacterized protein (DUF2062 family)